MSTVFLDEIQIDEFDSIFELYEDNWESMIETDPEDWSMVEK